MIRIPLLAAYCLVIYWLSDQSHLPVPMVFEGQDKLIHATAYAGMALVFWYACRGMLPWRWLFVVVVLFCSLYGISDEWHQSFVSGRDADVWDWLADTTGAMLAATFMYNRETRMALRGD